MEGNPRLKPAFITAGVLCVISTIIIFLPIWKFIVRVLHFRHRVAIIGLIGCICVLLVCIGYAVFWIQNLMAATAEASECSTSPLAVVFRVLFSICQLCLYIHFLFKAQLLNRDGRLLTKLQIISILLILVIPVVACLVLLSQTATRLPDGECATTSNELYILLQGLVHAVNSAMPAISFIEQTCDLLLRLPRLEKSFKASNPVVRRTRLITTILVNPAGFIAPATVYSKTFEPDSTTVAKMRLTMRSTRSGSGTAGHMKVIRLVRRVLLATIWSFITTLIIYVFISVGLLGYHEQILYVFDQTISWCWAIYASPLPQESGNDRAFASWKGKATTSATATDPGTSGVGSGEVEASTQVCDDPGEISKKTGEAMISFAPQVKRST